VEGAKYCLAVLNDVHQRGVKDIRIACVDGLTVFPDRRGVPRDLGTDLHRALCRPARYADLDCRTGWARADLLACGRHNQNASRKARSASGGR
jgi:hypothetical protein